DAPARAPRFSSEAAEARSGTRCRSVPEGPVRPGSCRGESQVKCHQVPCRLSAEFQRFGGVLALSATLSSAADAGFPAAKNPALIPALRLLRQIADIRAGRREVVAELVFPIRDVFPLVVEADDGVRGRGDLLRTRAGEPPRENGEH